MGWCSCVTRDTENDVARGCWQESCGGSARSRSSSSDKSGKNTWYSFDVHGSGWQDHYSQHTREDPRQDWERCRESTSRWDWDDRCAHDTSEENWRSCSRDTLQDWMKRGWVQIDDWSEHSKPWEKRSGRWDSAYGADDTDGWDEGAADRKSEADEDETVWWDGIRYHGWEHQKVVHHDMVLVPRGMSRAASKVTLFFVHSCNHGPEDVFSYLPYVFDFGLEPQDVRVVAPCAPLRQFPDSTEEGNSWYEYTTDRGWRGKHDRVSFEQFMEQRRGLLALLEEEHQRLAPGGCIVLGGLSQGAALAVDLVLHAPSSIDSICGCFCTRGTTQEESKYDLDWELVDMRAKTVPVFVYHGSWDQTIPWQVARQSYFWLQRTANFDVTFFVERGVQHSTESIQEYSRVAKFIVRAISRLSERNMLALLPS